MSEPSNLCGRFGDLNLLTPSTYKKASCTDGKAKSKLVLRRKGRIQKTCDNMSAWGRSNGWKVSKSKEAKKVSLDLRQEGLADLSIRCVNYKKDGKEYARIVVLLGEGVVVATDTVVVAEPVVAPPPTPTGPALSQLPCHTKGQPSGQATVFGTVKELMSDNVLFVEVKQFAPGCDESLSLWVNFDDPLAGVFMGQSNWVGKTLKFNINNRQINGIGDANRREGNVCKMAFHSSSDDMSGESPTGTNVSSLPGLATHDLSENRLELTEKVKLWPGWRTGMSYMGDMSQSDFGSGDKLSVAFCMNDGAGYDVGLVIDDQCTPHYWPNMPNCSEYPAPSGIKPSWVK